MSNSPRRKLLDSFGDAFRGLWNCIRSERNMRIHLTACAYVLFFGFQLGLSRGELACLLVTIGTVMAAEAMNTAVEKLCDFAERKRNPHIRLVKDLAAGAVLAAALFAALVGLVIFARPELLALLQRLCSAPASLALLLLSLCAAFLFVFAGPEKLCGLFRKKTRS